MRCLENEALLRNSNDDECDAGSFVFVKPFLFDACDSHIHIYGVLQRPFELNHYKFEKRVIISFI